MSENYNVVYVDLDTGNKLYLDRPVNSPHKQFKYVQNSASSVWTIFHQQNMNTFVSVFYDQNGNEIKPTKYHIDDPTTAVAEFNAPIVGQALLIFFENE